MNFEERKNVFYRIIASLILLITAGIITFSFITVIKIEQKHTLLFAYLLTLCSSNPVLGIFAIEIKTLVYKDIFTGVCIITMFVKQKHWKFTVTGLVECIMDFCYVE